MPRTVAEDFRTMDPVAYIRSLGLQPEDRPIRIEPTQRVEMEASGDQLGDLPGSRPVPRPAARRSSLIASTPG